MQLAPYTPAMRIGAGFNTYTQQVCINDAVIRDGKRESGETKLVIKPNPGEVPQIVTWTSKFVENVSEVNEGMNVSGSIKIKTNGIEGAGNASYLNTDKMKESDINYFVRVKVVNQTLIAPDLTRFNTLPHNTVTGARFTDIYGDAFISGFVYGGEFNALMSVKVKDKENMSEIKGALALKMDKAGLNVDAKAELEIAKKALAENAEISISVSWSGGGKIIDPNAGEWNIDSMKTAAYAFPDKVAKHPYITDAILTKYSALRSYQELINKGTPLDYENAGVYTNSLLDAYTEYKEIWRNIQALTKLIQEDTSKELVQAQELSMEGLEDYLEHIEEEYTQKVEYFNTLVEGTLKESGEKKINPDADSKVGTAGVKVPLPKPLQSSVVVKGKIMEAPLAPNPLKPYVPNFIGLDEAMRDCRWEMIKIIKEVDEVTEDPQVAIDIHRMGQYLSPAIFRELLPTIAPPIVDKFDEKTAKEEIEALKTRLASLETENTKFTEVEKNSRIMIRQETDVLAKGLSGPNTAVDVFVPFEPKISAIPRLVLGLSHINIEGGPPAIGATVREVTKEGFQLRMDAAACDPKDLQVNWITIPDSDMHCEIGTNNTWGMTNESNTYYKFSKPFTDSPRVRNFIQAFHIKNMHRSIAAYARDHSTTGFKCTVKCDHEFSDGAAWVASIWFAYDSTEDGKRIISGHKRANQNFRDDILFEFEGSKVQFAEPPTVYWGIQSFTFDEGGDFCIKSVVKNVRTDGFFLELSTSQDSSLKSMAVDWIAFGKII